MAIYEHRKLLIAYTWCGTKILTPAWFDNNFGLRRQPIIEWVWGMCRMHRLIRMRYWGRADA